MISLLQIPPTQPVSPFLNSKYVLEEATGFGTPNPVLSPAEEKEYF